MTAAHSGLGERPPYSISAMEYVAAGWSPIPLPPGEKWPPPDDYTGEHGKYVTKQEAAAWSRSKPKRARSGNLIYAPGNVAIRLPPGIIGLDADLYSGKSGADALRVGEQKWGKLPDTWMSSSRDDGSGIRLYRVPAGLQWPGDLRRLTGHGGVELIRPDHRYAIVFPSIHDKTGQTYRWWYGPGGPAEWGAWTAGDDDDGWEFPAPDDSLPELPKAWVEVLTGGRERTAGAAVGDLSEEQASEWIKGCNNASGRMCDGLQRTVQQYTRAIRTAGDDGGAHDAARDGAWAVLGDAAAGHSGVLRALSRIRNAFKVAVKGRREDRIARQEWGRIILRGVSKVAAEGEQELDDLCSMLEDDSSSFVGGSIGDSIHGSGGSAVDEDDGGDGGQGDATDQVARQREKHNKPGKGGSDPLDYSRDDIGNAQRLVRAHGHEMRWVPSHERWCLWDPNRKLWAYDNDGRMDRWTIKVQRDMEAEAEFIEDPKVKAAFLKFVRSCGNIGKLKSMATLASSLNGITRQEEDFDADPYLIGCRNGSLDLRGAGLPPNGASAIQRDGWEGVSLRPAIQEHYLTLNTGVDYVPGATSPEWDEFICQAQPDPEVRIWLQKLVGYSMLGLNPERLFMVVYGPTSTGKSTFMEVVNRVLGGYSSTFNLSLLRDSQDERPRADIVDALARRFIYAEEASAEWHLHPDQIKRLTGGTPVRARRPFARGYVEAPPRFTPWMVTNVAPTIDHSDPALQRRMLVVPFVQQVPRGKENTTLIARLTEPPAASAVLNWAVAGWEAYVRTGGLHEAPASTWGTREQFSQEMSESGTMLSSIVDMGTDFVEQPQRLFRAYTLWCNNNETPERDRMTQVKFGRWLSSQGYPSALIRVKGGPPRKYRVGLRLCKTYDSLVGADE